MRNQRNDHWTRREFLSAAALAGAGALIGLQTDGIAAALLRMREAGIIKSNPEKIVSQDTDWQFLNELKKELKA